MTHSTPSHAGEAFPEDVLKRIAAEIGTAETQTSAEIRVSIHDQRSESEGGKPIADVAKSEFEKLGMHKTNDRNGILLLILYSERAFYIYADSGIHRRTNPESWNDVATTLLSHFKEGRFEQGVIEGLRKMTHHLKQAAPVSDVNPNQHSNDVVMH